MILKDYQQQTLATENRPVTARPIMSIAMGETGPGNETRPPLSPDKTVIPRPFPEVIGCVHEVE